MMELQQEVAIGIPAIR